MPNILYAIQPTIQCPILPNQICHNFPPAGMCFLLYTGGDEEKLSCMARAACESPVAADNYLAAAKLWYKMHKLIQVLYCTILLYCTVLYYTVLIQAVPFNTKYTAIMETIYDASEHAKKVSPYTSIVGAQNEHFTSESCY